MKKIPSILVLVILFSCGTVDSENESKTHSESDASGDEFLTHTLTDTTIQFLWREMKYDSSLNDTFNSIFINQDYLSSLTKPEKAAIGYVATFIGNECWWDGEANENRSNLDCKIISALGLGYQCSDEHLGFLRKWFSTDKKVIAELKKTNCPTTPFTSTRQNTFDEIKLTVKTDSILVFYRANGINMREQESWMWNETVYFKVLENNIRLIKKVKSDVRYEEFEMTEN